MRLGNQKPQILIQQREGEDLDYSDVDECLRFGELIGIRCDEWQAEFVRLSLAKDEGGSYIHMTVALSIPRQNGKNEVVHLIEMYLLVFKGAHIIHTAHRVDTAGESFERIRSFFDVTSEYPSLTALVTGGAKHGICRTKGAWEIRLTNGGRIIWSVRSNQGRRGFDNISLVILDEAQDLTEEAMSSLKYTLAASKTSRQMIYMGTPPDPSANGNQFSSIRHRLIDGEIKGAYMQFGIESLGADPWETVRNVDNWYATNPAMGVRLDEGYTRDSELGAATSPEEFARERLGWWSEAGIAANAINPIRWKELGNVEHPPEGKICYAVKFSPDGETGTLAVAVKPDGDAPIFVEVIENRGMSGGVTPFADWILARRDNASYVAIDGAANAQPLFDKLRKGNDRNKALKQSAVGIVNTRQLADACSMLLDAVRDKTICHAGQKGLQNAIEGTCKRLIGNSGGWGFSASMKGIDATVPEAIALAYWAAKTTKRDARRKGRIG